MKKQAVAAIGKLLFVITAAGLISALSADETKTGEAATELKLETILSAQLEGVEGRDVIVSRVRIPPNSALPVHWHPGEEFAYVISGSTILHMEGEDEERVGPGEMARIPLKRVHWAETRDEGATILVFRVHERGQPERVLVE